MLLEPPGGVQAAGLGKDVFQVRPGDRRTFCVNHIRTAREGPIAPLRVLDINAAIDKQRRAIFIDADQNRGQFTSQLLTRTPLAEHFARLRDQRAQVRRRHGSGGGCGQLFERNVIRHRHREVGDPAKAFGVEALPRLPVGLAALTRISGIDVVGAEDRVEHSATRAIGEQDIAISGQPRALRRGGIERLRHRVETDDAQFVERFQFACVGHPVAVVVLPHLEF